MGCYLLDKIKYLTSRSVKAAYNEVFREKNCDAVLYSFSTGQKEVHRIIYCVEYLSWSSYLILYTYPTVLQRYFYLFHETIRTFTNAKRDGPVTAEVYFS
jgi:hypothetical protein